jgi:hypothetical protein
MPAVLEEGRVPRRQPFLRVLSYFICHSTWWDRHFACPTNTIDSNPLYYQESMKTSPDLGTGSLSYHAQSFEMPYQNKKLALERLLQRQWKICAASC